MQDHRRKLSNFLCSHCDQVGRVYSLLPFPGCSGPSILLTRSQKIYPTLIKQMISLQVHSRSYTNRIWLFVFFSFFKQNVFSHGLVSYQCQMTPDASTGPPVGAHGWEQRGDGPALSAPASQASLLEYSANFLANNKLITIFQRISEHLQFSI